MKKNNFHFSDVEDPIRLGNEFDKAKRLILKNYTNLEKFKKIGNNPLII